MGSRLIKRIGEQIEIKNIVWIVEFVLNKSRTNISIRKKEDIWRRKMEEEYLRICLIRDCLTSFCVTSISYTFQSP